MSPKTKFDCARAIVKGWRFKIRAVLESLKEIFHCTFKG